jgi:hypothetical protein
MLLSIRLMLGLRESGVKRMRLSIWRERVGRSLCLRFYRELEENEVKLASEEDW